MSLLQCKWVSLKDCFTVLQNCLLWLTVTNVPFTIHEFPVKYTLFALLPPTKNRKVNCITSVLISPGYYRSRKRNWKQYLCEVFGGKQDVHVFVHCMVQQLVLQNKQFCLTGKGALLLKKFEEIKANYSALLEKISKLTEERLVFRMWQRKPVNMTTFWSRQCWGTRCMVILTRLSEKEISECLYMSVSQNQGNRSGDLWQYPLQIWQVSGLV